MAVQNRFAGNVINRSFTQAPAGRIPQETAFEQVIVVLDGSAKGERALPQALEIAREHKAELVLIHVYPASLSADIDMAAEQYLKSATTRVKAQYTGVLPYLYRGTDIKAAVASVVNEQAFTCLMMPEQRQSWLQAMWTVDLVESMERRYPCMMVKPVES
ncbi:MAG: universal stress protein [Chloroflexota bacterium]